MSRYLILGNNKSYQWPGDDKRSLLEKAIPDIKNSDNWTISEWKEYVNYLNSSGIELLKKLAETEKKLDTCKNAKSRGKDKSKITKKYNPSKSLLFYGKKAKYAGRPLGSKNREIARKALFIQFEALVLKNKNIKNIEALAIYYVQKEKGLSIERARNKARKSRAIRNEMSKFKKS